MATIVTGTNGTNGTNGPNPTPGTKGGNATYSKNGTIGADLLDLDVKGGKGGRGGNGTGPTANGANGGNGGDASATVNGNIFNNPAGTVLTVQALVTGGEGGDAGTSDNALPGLRGNGGNATVSYNGNIINPNKTMNSISLLADAVGGDGEHFGNATATVNGNIVQPLRANSVTLEATATAFGPDSVANHGNLAFGTKTATVNGNIVQGNIRDVTLAAEAYPSNGTARLNGNIVQLNGNNTNSGTVTLIAGGNTIEMTNNKVTLNKQNLSLFITQYNPYTATIQNNEFYGTGTNTFSFTVTAIPGPYSNTVEINLANGTFTFNGQNNVLSNFNDAIMSGDVASTLVGNNNANALTGGLGGDFFTGGQGNDTIDGGAASDTAIYQGNYAQYSLSFIHTGNLAGTVTDLVPSRDGTDSLTNVEFLQFADGVYDVVNDHFTPTFPTNNPPVANNDSYATNEDTPLVVGGAGVLGNDTDADVDPLSAVLVTGPAHGSLTLNPDGSFTYTPNADYYGPDSFTYRANDGTDNSNVATVNLTVNPVNDAPVANNDSYATNEDTPLVVGGAGVLGNDTDVDSDPLSAVVVTGPTHGALTLNPDGSFTYTPNANYYGADSFTYKANDGAVDSNIATVNLTVNPVNDAPVAVDDTFITDEDTPLVITAPGILGNDTDVEGSPLTVSAIVTGPAHGSLVVNPDGSFTYTPDADYHGADSFTYRANDGTDDSNIATVNLTVNPVNDAPVAVDDAFLTDEDTALVIAAAGVLGNDTDADVDPLTAVLVTGPAHGSLTLNPDGSFTYTPDANYHGADSFTYRANDGTDDSNIATVNLTINPVNDAPVAVDDTYATDLNTPLVVGGAGVLGNDTDVDVDPLTAALVTGPAHGSLTLNSDGSFTYTPDFGYSGADSFTYRANDGTDNSNIATVNLTVGTGQTFFGTPGDDNLTGGAGDDIFYATTGTDTLDGGAHINGDTVIFTNATSGVTANLDPAQQDFTASGLGLTTLLNIENLTGSNYDDVLTGDANHNVLSGGLGDDVLVASAGNDTLDGGANGAGGDTADFSPGTMGVTVDLNGQGAPQSVSAEFGNVTLNGIENVTGTDFADMLTGDAGNNVLNGLGGDDTIAGGQGDDTVDGGNGVDTAIFSSQPGVGDLTYDGTSWTVTGPDGTDTLTNVEVVDDGAGARILLVGSGGFTSINDAIAAANAGDTILIAPGVYNENVLVDKSVTLLGAGPGVIVQGSFETDNGIVGDVNTFLRTAPGYTGAAGNGIEVAADNVTLENITVDGFLNAVAAKNSGGAVSGLTLNNVTMQDSVFGLIKDDTTTLNGLTLNGGLIQDAYIGVYFYNDDPTDADAVDTTISGTTFQDITQKGIYAETAQGNTLIDGIVMNNVGQYGGGVAFGANGANGSGIDLNLKFHTYVGNVTISNFDFDNVGASTGVDPTGHQNAAAIAVKGRDDPGHALYGVNPADVSGLTVNIVDGSIDGTSTGIRAGEAGKANSGLNVTGPALTIDNVEITGNLSNGKHDQIDNRTQSQMTVLGSGNDDTYISAQTITSTGPIALYGYGGNDYLVGGAGDDTLQGGTGDDILDGGSAGSDTADYSDATVHGLVASLMTGASSGGGLGNDTLVSIRNLIGSDYDDVLVGDDGDNALDGGQGNDILWGHGGFNAMTGGAGTDVAYYVGRETDYTVIDTGFGTTLISGGLEGVNDGILNADIERLKFLAPSHVADVDNDGSSETVFQNNATGDLEITGSAPVTVAGVGGVTWRAVGTGQFDPDADRGADVLLQDSVTGDLKVITDLTGAQTQTLLSTQPGSNAWKAIATGDFNGDAASDVLLQNQSDGSAQIMFLNTNTTDAVGTVAGAGALATPGANWKVIAAGDFNGDGKSDVLWQNSSTKAVQVHLMDGINVTNTPATQAASGLTALGTGDFNGDGFSDVLFKNASGQAVVWFMYGDARTGTKTINKPGPGTWNATGAADVDGNGYSDVIWSDASNNASATLLGGPSSLASATVLNGNFGLSSPGPAFHMVASTGGG